MPTNQTSAGEVELRVLERVREQIEECSHDDSGRWETCSGCHESEDGHDVGFYPHSDVFGCKLGGGCHECGGIGACWDTTDYEEYARFMLAEHTEEEQALLTADREGWTRCQGAAAAVCGALWTGGHCGESTVEIIQRQRFNAAIESAAKKIREMNYTPPSHAAESTCKGSLQVHAAEPIEVPVFKEAPDPLKTDAAGSSSLDAGGQAKEMG